MNVRIALDATYSIGDVLSGVGLYSQEILHGLAAAHPEARFDFCYRPHRYLRARQFALPPNARRRVLLEPLWPRGADLFHGLNQRLPRLPFRRAIATFHDLFMMTAEYATPEFRARFAAQARNAAARADAIIAVSEFTRGQVIALLGVEPARVHVVHHGIRQFPESAVTAAREPVILNVGAIQKRKNIARLVEAFECLLANSPDVNSPAAHSPDVTSPAAHSPDVTSRAVQSPDVTSRAVQSPAVHARALTSRDADWRAADWRLVLAGSNGYGSEEILARIANSPVRQRILVTGYVSPRELAEWYARASVFAFPSLDEGFGMPVLEAMAAGVPVITSNCSALPEVAGDAALLVDPGDTEALYQALRSLTIDVDLRQALTRRGIERARTFTWGRAVRETWDVYRKTLG